MWDVTMCSLVDRYQCIRETVISIFCPIDGDTDSSAMLATICQITWRHNPQDRNLNIHCHENLKSHTKMGKHQSKNSNNNFHYMTDFLDLSGLCPPT
jgi:hypothetical protein